MTRTLFLLLVAVVGCSSGGNSSSKDGSVATDRRRPPPPNENWQNALVQGGNVGLDLRLAIRSGGSPSIAYFTTKGKDGGRCMELNAMFCKPPPGACVQKTLWELHYAEQVGLTWKDEKVVDVLQQTAPPGLDLVLASDGTPRIATLTGAPLSDVLTSFCGNNDLAVYSKSGSSWSAQTLVKDSGEAGCPMATQPECTEGSDAGTVVGFWPAAAFDQMGQLAVAYQDVHYANVQQDDLEKADLEMAWPKAIPVDMGRGAGIYTRLRFDSQNRPTLAYYNPVESTQRSAKGIWAARSTDHGATWKWVQLLTGATQEGPDLLSQGSDLFVAFYDGKKGQPTLATLKDDSKFDSVAMGWDLKTFGDSQYDEGYETSVAMDSQNHLAVAYYRCARATRGLGNCNGTEDGLVFAWRQGTTWNTEVVDEGVEGQCGHSPKLAFTPAGALIVYQCQDMGPNGLEDTIRIATREPL